MSQPCDTGRVAVRPLRRPGGLPPLFLIAAPEVNALGYVALARCLSPRESPYAVQTARGTAPAVRGDYAARDIAELAGEYLAAVRVRQPEGPYFLAGMCDGAHIAFDMARALRTRGEEVGLLAMLDTWPVENSARYSLVVIESLRKRLAAARRARGIGWVRAALEHALGAAKNAIAAWAMGSPAAASTSEAERWRARAWPGPGFVPPVYDGPITVLRARWQAYYRLRDATLGWSARSREPVRVHAVPGDHEGLLRRPHVEAVARALGVALDEARDRVGVPPARLELRRLS